MSNKNIKRKIASGAMWTLASRLVIRGISAISIVVVAKFLSPTDYGIVAVAVLFQSFLEMFFIFGLETFLIRHKNPSTQMYNTVWTLNLVSRLIIALLMLVFADKVAIFFEEPILIDILPWYAFSTLLRGFVSIGVVDFVRDMNFKKEFIYNVSFTLVGFSVALYFAWLLNSYWAFVYATLAQEVSRVIFSYILSRKIQIISFGAVNEVISFSKWIFVHSFTTALTSKIDWLILSKYSTSSSLGLYRVANEISGSVASEIAMPLARSLLPGLSQINSKDNLEEVFNSILSLTVSLAIPISFGIALISSELVGVLFNDEWGKLSDFISVLAFVAVPSVVSALYISSAFASGGQKYVAFTSVIRVMIYLTIIPLGFYILDVIGLVYGVVISSWLYLFVILVIMNNDKTLRVLHFIKNIIPSLIASLLMFLVLKELDFSDLNLIGLLLKILIGFLVYVVSLIIFYVLNFGNKDPIELVINKYILKR
jgi:lipopolysaccharide exporter